MNDFQTEESARAFWASLDEKSKLELAKTAPRVAGPWRPGSSSHTASRERYMRMVPVEEIDVFENPPDGLLATVFKYRNYRVNIFDSRGVPLCGQLAPFDTIESAKSACDARLRELGFVLEDGE